MRPEKDQDFALTAVTQSCKLKQQAYCGEIDSHEEIGVGAVKTTQSGSLETWTGFAAHSCPLTCLFMM